MLTLTATDLPRFMTCNGYPQMPHNAPFNTGDTDRNEGNAAHWLVEQVHSGKHTFAELVDRKAFNGVFITEEMVDFVTPYYDVIKGKGQVELDTSYSDGQRYSIRGRADHIDFDPTLNHLYVKDFKYGWGIIEPVKNWTLISHAIGFIWNHLGGNFPGNITLTIYQPRPHHHEGKIRSHTYSGEELAGLMNEMFAALCNPKNELRTSENCKRCPALSSCHAAAKAGLNAIDVAEVAFVSEIGDKDLGFMLDNIERAIKMLEQSKKAYCETALHRIKAGHLIPGYGRETELTNRQWKDGVTAESMLFFTGIDLSKKQLVTPTQAIKTGVSEELIDKTFTERREKGSKLIRINADQAVKKLFGGLK